jgi:hypothetical protein
MEFDLMIVPKQSQEGWEEALSRIEKEAMEEPLSEDQASVWDRVVERLEAEDAFEMLRSDERIELTLTDSGIQIEMFEQGVSIHCSNEGETVAETVDTTNRIVETITAETGWATFDPDRGEEVTNVDYLGPGNDVAGRAKRALDRDRLVYRPNPPWWKFWDKG